MYAVIRYFNYRKEVSFKILKTFNDFEKADTYALKCAEDDFGEDVVVQGVSEKWVYVDDVMDGYTKGDGYDQFVYTVIEFDEPEDELEDEDEVESSKSLSEELDTGFDFVKQKNEMYEWGFDLTDFNEENDDDDETIDKKEWVKNFLLNEKHDYEEPYDSEDEEGIDIVFQQEYKPPNKGALKFSKLLQTYNLELDDNKDKGYMWKNTDGSLKLITANNPLTGKYYNGTRNSEVGYLSYVGISCANTSLLQHVILSFREHATYIKGESNQRDYI